MSKSRSLFRRLALGSVALVLCGLGADTPTQTIDAGGLTFQAPASWKSAKPTSTMRKAQLSVEPVKGDPEPAELLVFAFPGRRDSPGQHQPMARVLQGRRRQPAQD